jgi:Flp pilus assembly protein TadG
LKIIRERRIHPGQKPARSEQGQALVEFALTIVVVFVVLVSFLELVMLLYTYSTLANSAKEGVRYAVVHGTGQNAGGDCEGPGTATVTWCDASATATKQRVAGMATLSLHGVSTTNVTVDYNPDTANGANACNTSGCMVRVSISYPYTPFFGLGWPTVTVNAAAQGRIVY